MTRRSHALDRPAKKRPERARRRSRPEILAVTFDVGGTLIKPWPSVGHVYAEEAARYGHPNIPVPELNRRFAAAWRELRDFRHTREQWAALVRDTFGRLVPPGACDSFFPALYQRFAEPNAWQVFDDVLPVLKRLKARGLRLGIISNWDARLRPLLRLLKLDSYFETVVISCEVDAPKPAPAIFREAARALRVPPENILHVGDGLEADFRGAGAASFQAAWLRRGRTRLGPQQVGSLYELLRQEFKEEYPRQKN